MSGPGDSSTNQFAHIDSVLNYIRLINYYDTLSYPYSELLNERMTLCFWLGTTYIGRPLFMNDG